jgi:hypothetical protein
MKRKKVKFPGLDKSVNSKNRQDLIDHDYIDQLNDKEKQFLSDFNEEYISGNFKHNGPNNFHKTTQSKRNCYNRNNARNRCMYTIAKSTSRLFSEEDILQNVKCIENDLVENQIVKYFDSLIMNLEVAVNKFPKRRNQKH